jgi:hypothetical protein
MPNKPTSELARNAGELRQWIASNKYDWTVDPRLRDTDPLPNPHRGGKPDPRPPANAIAPKTVTEYLREQPPPTNPFLRERWMQLKLLKARKSGFPAGSPADVVTSSQLRSKKQKRSGKERKR